MIDFLDISYDLLQVKHQSVTCPRLLQRFTLLNILHSLSKTCEINYILYLWHDLRLFDLLPLYYLCIRFLRLLHVFLVLLSCHFLLPGSFLQILSYPLSCILHFFYLRFIILLETHGLCNHHVKFFGAHHLTHLNIQVISSFQQSVSLDLIPHIFLLHQKSRMLKIPLFFFIKLFLCQTDLETFFWLHYLTETFFVILVSRF